MPQAKAAQSAGYDVVVATRVAEHGDAIRRAGFRLIPLRLQRESYSPLQEFQALHELRSIYAEEQPDIAHHVALKPILYGSVAALGRKQIRVINAWAGMGFLVASTSFKASIIRSFLTMAFRYLLNRPGYSVLVQNQDDADLVASRFRVPPGTITVIRGSGVDLASFRPMPEPGGAPMVLFASRMLWLKGVSEFVTAAEILRGKGVSARFVLAGDTDEASPAAVPRAQLQAWNRVGAVEWVGWQNDIAEWLGRSTLVCLPSYREGIPKVLLEAAASGRAIVATDVPGCRDIVRDGENGLLVAVRNAGALASAIERLLNDPTARRRMAARGREIVAQDFGLSKVVEATLALYARLQPSTTSRPAALGRD